MKTKFKLEKAAQKAGGDRYVAESGWTIYVPQEISREGGVPKQELTVTVE
jgi:hypothetical protein